MPNTLNRCTHLTEFNVENNALISLPDGLLANFTNLGTLTLSRNKFESYPGGGPVQFGTVSVSLLLNSQLFVSVL